MRPIILALTLPFLLVSSTALSERTHAQSAGASANYDESKVGAYTLPDLLTTTGGVKVADAAAWRRTRRPEILKLFETHVFGRSPDAPAAMSFKTTSIDRQALGGKATRKQVSILLSERKDGGKDTPRLDLLIYIPNAPNGASARPAPAFLGFNYFGNQSVTTDPGVTMSEAWMRPSPEHGIVANRATEKSRGAQAHRWPIEQIIARGYAVVTAYYGDLDPDYDDGFKNGVQPLFYCPGQERPADDEWGAIAAWAWGLSRALDYLEKDDAIDAKRVAVVGHSRHGKAALWAGARDERFAMVISNDSGEGGAALARRDFGETIERINSDFPHWFCTNFKKYNGAADRLPVDSHMLIALIAPRPVYVASAADDLWADPRGEFLGAKHAEPAYRLFGLEGLGSGVADMPPIDRPVGQTIGYHVRTGKHDITAYDWQQFMTFADRHFAR